MKIGIIIFPGSNRYLDLKICLEQLNETNIDCVWYQSSQALHYDLIILPGGFSYGDQQAPGAIAAREPIINSLRNSAKRGVSILGICNGFQILTQAGLLPGKLLSNVENKFICKNVKIEIVCNKNRFTKNYSIGQIIKLPVAHQSGRYVVTTAEAQLLHDNEQIIMRYQTGSNNNGSIESIAGILNKSKNICGLMPHPENSACIHHGDLSGQIFFRSILESFPWR